MSNFHKDLTVTASTRDCVKLSGASQKGLQVQAPGEEGAYEAAQDIDTFGIAGRTWEAAYAMQLYLTPPPPPPSSSASTSSATFSPPNPLFAPSSSSSPASRTILEIGSGTGFLMLSLAPHLRPSDTLLLTDLDEVIPLMEANLAAARAHAGDAAHWPTTLVRGLPWGDDAALREVVEEVGVPDVILASDLVYFPALYPPLLRTYIGLTDSPSYSEPGAGIKDQTLLFAYKVRSFPREEPFWNAFGYWFDFEPVLIATPPPPPPPESESESNQDQRELAEKKSNEPTSYTRFGTGEDEIYVFVCRRKEETRGREVPLDDGMLMSLTDDQFERLLMCEIDYSIE